MKNENAKHTPEPWKVSYGDPSASGLGSWHTITRSPGNVPLARVVPMPYPERHGILREGRLERLEKGESNAAFIVHACNNIERVETENRELRSICKRFLTEWGNMSVRKSTIDQMIAAIAKAEGR